MFTKILTITAAGLILSGCGSMGPNESAGTVIGGVTGAAVGASLGGDAAGSVVGAGVGAAAGGLVGGAVGREMDNSAPRTYYYKKR